MILFAKATRVIVGDNFSVDGKQPSTIIICIGLYQELTVVGHLAELLFSTPAVCASNLANSNFSQKIFNGNC